MPTKGSVHCVLILLLMGISPASADTRQIVKLRINQATTVGDLMTSPINGRFNIPTVPQFTHRSLFQALPEGMLYYPAQCTIASGTITAAAMVRFIRQSHTLFRNRSERATYEKAIQDLIKAHKIWYENDSEQSRIELHEAEDDVLEYLKTIKLNNAKTRKTLEDILSSPTYMLPTRILRKFILPNRSSIAFIPTNDRNQPKRSVVLTDGFLATVIKQYWQSNYMEAPAVAIAGGAIALAVCAHKKVRHETVFHSCFIAACASSAIYALTVLPIRTIYAWLTDVKLTPEPGSGIKVIIQTIHTA